MKRERKEAAPKELPWHWGSQSDHKSPKKYHPHEADAANDDAEVAHCNRICAQMPRETCASYKASSFVFVTEPPNADPSLALPLTLTLTLEGQRETGVQALLGLLQTARQGPTRSTRKRNFLTLTLLEGPQNQAA